MISTRTARSTRGVLENRCPIRPVRPVALRSLLEAQGTHLVRRTTHHDVPSYTVRLLKTEAQFLERTPQQNRRELLRDVRSHDLQRHRYGQELAGLLALRTAEVLVDELLLQRRRLELFVMAGQTPYLVS